MSIMTKAVDALKGAGIKAYLPGRAPGDCKQAHAVVADGGRQATGKTTGRHLYYVTAYVPEARPNDLAGLLTDVQEALLTVRELKSSGDISEAYFDQDKGAHAAAVEYYALCRI